MKALHLGLFLCLFFYWNLAAQAEQGPPVKPEVSDDVVKDDVVKAADKTDKANNSDATSKALAEIYQEYRSAEYEKALKGLDKIQANLSSHARNNQDIKGLVHYWKGLCHLRLNEFDPGIEQLERAIKSGYETADLFYEYGQALYTSLKLKKARIAFKKSILKRYKMAVSMYYIASISQELGDYKTAATFFNGIERLPAAEKKDVVQAARMRLGDIYLEQVKKQGGDSDSIEKYVLPQYRKALEWDDEGALASEIKGKIQTLERRYDLVLFKLRNGRPTARPPFFVKANVKYSQNDNVNAYDEDTKSALDESQYAAAASHVGFYGRHSFYPSSAFSFTPQINFSHTKYMSDEKLVTKNNGYFATATLQTTYEHTYNKAPATGYLNLNYTHSADDADQDDQLEKASSTTGFTLSEELQFWTGNPSIFRIKRNETVAVAEGGDFTTTGLIYEQVLALGNTMAYLYTGYDMMRYPDAEESDNNALTFRADLLLPDYKGLFNTNLYASVTQSDYIEDSSRGKTNLVTYGANFNRPFGKNYFVYFDISQTSQSGDLDSDNYTQQIMSMNLDYIF